MNLHHLTGRDPNVPRLSHPVIHHLPDLTFNCRAEPIQTFELMGLLKLPGLKQVSLPGMNGYCTAPGLSTSSFELATLALIARESKTR